MRPRLVLSLCLATFPLVAVACTAILGDFEEGRIEVTPDAQPDDAGTSSFGAYTCVLDEREMLISRLSTTTAGEDFVFTRYPDLTNGSARPRVLLRQQITLENRNAVVVRTYKVLNPGDGDDGGVPDLEGELVSSANFPGGLAVLTNGFRASGQGFRAGLFLSKLYDNEATWRDPIQLNGNSFDECGNNIHAALHLINAETDDYLIVWSQQVGTHNDAGACSGVQLPPELYGRHFVGGGDAGDAGAIYRLDPDGGLPSKYFLRSSIAPFDGGVVTLVGGDSDAIIFTNSAMDLRGSAGAPPFEAGAIVPIGISATPSGSSSIRAAFFFVSAQNVTLRSGSIAADRVATVDLEHDLGSTPLDPNGLFVAHNIGVWSDFASGYDPHSLLVSGVDYNHPGVARISWLDTEGHEHARVAIDAGTGDPFRALSVTRRSLNGEATGYFNIVSLRGEAILDGGEGTLPLALWTRSMRCDPLDAGH